jgi:hypothetical protein
VVQAGPGAPTAPAAIGLIWLVPEGGWSDVDGVPESKRHAQIRNG